MPKDTPIATSINSLRRSSSNSANSVTVESRGNSLGKAVHRSNTKATGQSPKQVSETGLSPSIPASSLDYSKLRILIVEDNLVNQKVLQKQLRNLGFLTEVANHGGEALDILKYSHFWAGKESSGQDLAIILMDLEMPVMDGLTCARKIRELEADRTIVRHVPIIAVSANARIQQIENAMAAGMVSLS